MLDAPSFKKGFLVDQDVTYYTKADKDPVKTVNSLLTLEVNSSGKIIRHCASTCARERSLNRQPRSGTTARMPMFSV